jgi:hypothetical protein
MGHFTLLFTAISVAGLVGCGAASEDDSSVLQDSPVQPESGEWEVVTSGWTDDDCNAAEGLNPPSSMTVSDVMPDSFEVTLYDGDTRIGEGSSTCIHDADDVYNCEELINSFSYPGMNVNMTVSGGIDATLTSEYEMSVKSVLTLECTGSDCPQVAMQTNSGSIPCDSTINLTLASEADES